MLEAPARKNYRYSPNPVPRSVDIYSSINQIKAGGSLLSSQPVESTNLLNLAHMIPHLICKLDAEEEKPHVYESQALKLNQVQKVQEVLNSQRLKKNENDGFWGDEGQEDSDEEVYIQPEKREERLSKRVKLLEVDEEEQENQEMDKRQRAKKEIEKQVKSLSNSKNFQGLEDLKRQFIGEQNIEEINQRAFQDMMKQRKENVHRMEMLRKLTDEEEFKRIDSNLNEEQENDMQDIMKEHQKIKMSENFVNSRSKFSESMLQHMIERHIQKEMQQSIKEDQRFGEESTQKKLIGGKEMIRMTYENGSVKIKREVMESPVVALELSGGQKILTKRSTPRNSQRQKAEEVKVEQSELKRSEIKESSINVASPRADNYPILVNSQPIQEPKKEKSGDNSEMNTPGKVEAVTKAEVTEIGKSKPQIEELKIEDVKLQAKADNQVGGLEILSPAVEADNQNKKKRQIKKGKDKMKIKGGCCGGSSCSIF